MTARSSARKSWMLAALLVVGFVAVPLAHGAHHAQKKAEAAPGTARIEAPCDLCHLSYVAVSPAAPLAVEILPVGRADDEVRLTPPSTLLLARRPRGPPVCS